MKLGATLLSVILLVGSAALVFHLFQRQLSGASFAFGVPAEVLIELQASLDDQRELARLDPPNEKGYRARFDEVETTVHRLQILEHNRDALVRRYELILLVVFTVSVVLVACGGGGRRLGIAAPAGHQHPDERRGDEKKENEAPLGRSRTLHSHGWMSRFGPISPC